jgi:hypothetical protein
MCKFFQSFVKCEGIWVGWCHGFQWDQLFLHSMLVKESTLKNHFIVHPKLDRCEPCDVKLEVKNTSQATLKDG